MTRETADAGSKPVSTAKSPQIHRLAPTPRRARSELAVYPDARVAAKTAIGIR